MTPAERKKLRVAVAHDVLRMLDQKVLIASQGDYFHLEMWKSPGLRFRREPSLLSVMKKVKKATDETGKPECKACAIGSLFIAHLIRTEDTSIKAEPTRGTQTVSFTTIDNSSMRLALNDAFSLSETAIMEGIFERAYHFVYRHNPMSLSEDIARMTNADSLRATTAEERLRWLMQLVIDQKDREVINPIDTPLYRYLTGEPVKYLARITYQQTRQGDVTVHFPELSSDPIQVSEQAWNESPSRAIVTALTQAMTHEELTKVTFDPPKATLERLEELANTPDSHLISANPLLALRLWPHLGN